MNRQGRGGKPIYRLLPTETEEAGSLADRQVIGARPSLRHMVENLRFPSSMVGLHSIAPIRLPGLSSHYEHNNQQRKEEYDQEQFHRRNLSIAHGC